MFFTSQIRWVESAYYQKGYTHSRLSGRTHSRLSGSTHSRLSGRTHSLPTVLVVLHTLYAPYLCYCAHSTHRLFGSTHSLRTVLLVLRTLYAPFLFPCVCLIGVLRHSESSKLSVYIGIENHFENNAGLTNLPLRT